MLCGLEGKPAMSYHADSDFDPYDEPAPDEAQLGLDREQADLDAEADRFEYLAGFEPVAAPQSLAPRELPVLLLVEQPDGTFAIPEAA